ncbi:tRNA(Met) cytidine acetyltransferase TmcA [Endozoicomonas numazuensis]|uniref:tRNA(Met) cytidine acetyltransferase TmcA n=1 Tax=Endozoicomonas numazuensis TaxID=1137799 RepID=UPI000A6F9BC5|nr:GNAT family N-acetyltransferase [Endozoicomonas numazuensis]
MLQVESILKKAADRHHRSFIVLSGSQVWAQNHAEGLSEKTLWQETLWVGERFKEGEPFISATKAVGWLGREIDCIVFNAFSGFDVDAFGQISGALKGGGLFVLLVPEWTDWPDYCDPDHKRLAVYPFQTEHISGFYLKRLAELIEQDTSLSLLRENKEASWQQDNFRSYVSDTNIEPVQAPSFSDSACRTSDQFLAVESILRVAKGHRRRPLVLTADRGRGKSAALGIAAARLMQSGLSRIWVTAPSLASAEVVFKTAETLLEGCETHRGSLLWEDKILEFKAPDELLHSDCHADCELMLVDEAAAIPVPLLTHLLKKQARIVFSSTRHGYEGTGRGFAIKFKSTLCELTPKWKGLHLKQPIRWAENDPFESFVFKALMLNAVPAPEETIQAAAIQHCLFERIKPAQLIQDEPLLSDLFGLLVLAHYRTRPLDLRHLLDGPNIETYCLRYQGRVVATALLALEGGIEDSLHEAIWLGQRRVRGHLIPQSLSNHCGFPEASGFSGLRVIRIAVHPSLQRAGLGSHLLNCIEEVARLRKLDYLGSSFGATSELAAFWGQSGYIPVRIGITREAASGCYSMMVLKSLNKDFHGLTQEMVDRFNSGFLMQLSGAFREMDSDLVRELLRFTHSNVETVLDQRDIMDLNSFACSDRLFESCLPAVRSLLLSKVTDDSAPHKAINGLIAKVLQGHDWSEIARANGLTGRKQAIQWLKQCVQSIVY